MPKPIGPTPMMEQYNELKRRHPEALLMIRLGDFYELFNEDAEIASKELGLFLTGREIGTGNRMPMCGVPHHALNEYLPRLVKMGYKVAIADQLEDPKAVKGLVKRDIVRIVTPGILEGDEGSNNFISAVFFAPGGAGLATCDASTGEFRVTQSTDASATEKISKEIERISPSELLVPEDRTLPDGVRAFRDTEHAIITARPNSDFTLERAASIISGKFGTYGIEGFGMSGMTFAITAAGALLSYLRQTQRSDLGHIERIAAYSLSGFMNIDKSSWRNIAAFGNERGKGGGLLDIITGTSTKMGSRMLRSWLEAPLTDVAAIAGRLDAVGELMVSRRMSDRIADCLKGMPDIERIGSKLAFNTALPREVAALGRALAAMSGLSRALMESEANGRLRRLQSGIDPLEALSSEISKALEDELPADLSSGGYIRKGYNEEVDELRKAADGGRGWLAALEVKERERSGIKNLRVGYNQVFGYYFEVGKSNAGNVPADFIRKQTLAGSERYFTEELKEIETKVLGAEEKKIKLEAELFRNLCAMASKYLPEIMGNASAAAETDTLLAFAEAAQAHRWVRPVVNDGQDTILRSARHPVMEANLPAGRFVENDIEMRHDDGRLLIITGPNMAGKSTILATTGLIHLMAQAGSYVPCEEATIGVADRIFYRAGSYDDIAAGKSTFMVELLEVAEILNTATEKSLVLVDELGRGTSTYDGMALAWAVAEHFHDVTGSRTLFTTHYHELSALEERLPYARNYHVSVAERASEVVFLYRMQRGGTDKSYGLNVARMAGLPKDILRRANAILKQLEAVYDRGGHQMRLFGWSELPEEEEDNIVANPEPAALSMLRDADIDDLSPREALELLFRMKESLDSEASQAPSDKPLSLLP